MRLETDLLREMMEETLPILISVNEINGNVILRLDLDSHAQHGLDTKITLLTLIECQEIDEVTQKFSGVVGKTIEYETNNQTFWFTLDYR